MPVPKDCDGLQRAVEWALNEIGLTGEQRQKAFSVIWDVAAWQGDRELKNGRIMFAEEVAVLAHQEPK